MNIPDKMAMLLRIVNVVEMRKDNASVYDLTPSADVDPFRMNRIERYYPATSVSLFDVTARLTVKFQSDIA